MTALSTEAIRVRLLETNSLKRLVVSPLLDELAQLKPGQASIDVRLGFEFCLVTASVLGELNEFENGRDRPHSFSKLYRREHVPFGASIVIHPHQFMLAQTLEYLRLPPDLMSYVVGRSTWGRLGLIVATAVGVHPGFAGSLTLELRNLGETPLRLFPGQTIAQLFFHTVLASNGAPAQENAPDTQYVGTVDMIPQKISSTETYTALDNLRVRYESRLKP